MVDDILDITQSTEVLGKTAGKDLLSDKATYPSLLGLERSRQARPSSKYGRVYGHSRRAHLLSQCMQMARVMGVRGVHAV